jgi:hypothetical protein
VSFGPCQANILRGSEPQAVAHKNRVRVILPEATGACCDRSSRLSEPRAVAHLPGLSTPPGSAPARTSGDCVTDWPAGGFPRREEVPMMGPPPLSNTLQMIRASEYGRSEHSPDRIRQPSQIRREATGRPKVPCPPKSSFCRRGLMRFFSSPDRETGNTGLLCPGPRRIQSPLDSTPEGHRDSVNRRVRTVPFLLNLWDSPTTIGDWPDLQAGDTRPGPGSSLSHRA